MGLTLKIPRRLDSPNTWNGRHWRVKHRLSQVWEQEIGAAMCDITNASLKRQGKRIGLPTVIACFQGLARNGYEVADKVRVSVERQVPSARNFIRDDDNLRFSVKPLLDALKRQGYIKNDSRKWLEHPTPTQSVSPDGKDYTIVTIEPL